MIVSSIKFGRRDCFIKSEEFYRLNRLNILSIVKREQDRIDKEREDAEAKISAKKCFEQNGIKWMVKNQKFNYINILGLRSQAEKIELEMFENGEIEIRYLAETF